MTRVVDATRFARGLIAASALVLPQLVHAQAAPSAYTSGARYDGEGHITGTIAPDPDGAGPLGYAAVRNSYDANGRLVKVETGELASWQSEAVAPAAWTGFSVSGTVDSVYDLDGRKVKETLTGSDGVIKSVTQSSYDSLNRPVCVAVRMDPAQWTGQSDACVPQTGSANGADRITRTLYDATGQVSKVQKAVGTSLQQDYVSYTYTGSGKPASVTDANQTRAQYSYNTLDRLVRWTFPSKTTANLASTSDYEDYGYDLNGNRTSLRKRDGRVFSYSYDALGRMTVKIVPDACVAGYACTNVPASATRDVYYGYDNRGLATFVRFDSSAGEGITNAYDAAGRLASSSAVIGGVTRTLGYGWNANSARTTVTHPDGAVFAYGYDGLGRSTTLSESATSLASLVYDSQGRRSSQTRLAGVGTSYGYDAGSRLVTLADDVVGTGQDLTTTLGYNPASQIVSRTRSNDAFVAPQTPAARRYAVNGLNQYVSVNASAYSYDANGNLTNDGTTSYTYDAENRLTAAAGLLNASLAYDPLGRLYQTSAPSGAGLTRYLYDGDELLLEYDGNGVVQRRYVHGTAVDDPLVWYEGSGIAATARRHLFADHQGSIVGITDASGSPVAINSYDEWGMPGPANQGRFQYTGQAWIAELGMYHYKARIYSPLLGRFLQTDPIGYKDQMDLYAYVGNDPVNGTDPTGLTCAAAGGDKGYNCTVNVNAGNFNKKELALVNRAYTAAVNKLSAHPDRSVTVSLGGKSFKTTAGLVASSLIRAKVETGNGSARASTVGGGLTPGRAENGNAVTTINRNALYGDRSGGTEHIRSDLGRTFIHEGFHERPVDAVMAPIFNANPDKFNQDHRVPYNDASSALYQMEEPE